MSRWILYATQKKLKWQYAEPKFMENGLCGGLHPPITFFSKNPSIHMKWQKIV